MSQALVEYYREFPVEEHTGRADRLRVALDSQGLDAALLTYEPNIRWLTGFHIQSYSKRLPVAVLLTCGRDARTVFMCGSNHTGAEMAVVDEVRHWNDSSKPPFDGNASPAEVLAAVVKEYGLERSRVGMELGGGMRVDLAQDEIETLRAALLEMEAVDVALTLWRLRAIKSELEVDKLREAARITMEGYSAGFDAMREGMTEKELAAVLGSKWLELGATTPFNLNLAATWRSVRFAHVEPVNTPIQIGEIVNVDGGCTVDGYRADIFRLACIGEPTDPREVPMISSMIKAQRAAIATIKPGVTCGEVRAGAAQVLDEAGFGHLLTNSIGHSIGLEMHEVPHLSRGSAEVIEENMVLCVEPCLLDYSDWSIGRNYEDMVRVTADGTELLSPGFDDLVILPLLSPVAKR